MAVTITFLGHAGFLFSDGSATLAVDPFLTGNPVAVHRPEDIRCSHIALTHGHADHIGDTVAIATATGAQVIAIVELAGLLRSRGLTNLAGANQGGRVATTFGAVHLTPAFHSSACEGAYMGMPCGLIIEIGGVTIYHAGDTTVFGDMALIGELYRPDIAILPIGDWYTMGPRLATRAAELVQPKLAIPMHYKTFPALVQTAEAFTPKNIGVRELAPGESLSFGG